MPACRWSEKARQSQRMLQGKILQCRNVRGVDANLSLDTAQGIVNTLGAVEVFAALYHLKVGDLFWRKLCLTK